jgi:hypothetical protein
MITRYVRLYCDQSGESHFADVAEELTLVNFAPPADAVRLSSFFPATRTSFFSAPAGWTGDWHPAPARNLFVLVAGEWEITASDGETRTLLPGSIILVEDTKGKGHLSRVVSDEDSLAVLVQLA